MFSSSRYYSEPVGKFFVSSRVLVFEQTSPITILAFEQFVFVFGNLENFSHILQDFQSFEVEVVADDVWLE